MAILQSIVYAKSVTMHTGLNGGKNIMRKKEQTGGCPNQDVKQERKHTVQG